MGKMIKSVLPRETHRYKRLAVKNTLYNRAIRLRSLFVEMEMYRTHPRQWRILLDFIDLTEAGCSTGGQRSLVISYLMRFGEYSDFYKEFKDTIRIRDRYRQRIYHLYRTINGYKGTPQWQNLGLSVRRMYDSYRIVLLQLSRKLVNQMLTEEELRTVYDLEHKAGIWWDDIPDSENGLKLKSRDKIQEREETK